MSYQLNTNIIKPDQWPWGAAGWQEEYVPEVHRGIEFSAFDEGLNTGDLLMGWEFKVGNTPLTCTGLRVKSKTTISAHESRHLSLYNTSGTNLRQIANVSTSANSWVEYFFADYELSNVSLAANTNYILGARLDAGAGITYKSDVTFHSALSYVTGRYTMSTTGWPNTTHENALYMVVDILFTL